MRGRRRLQRQEDRGNTGALISALKLRRRDITDGRDGPIDLGWSRRADAARRMVRFDDGAVDEALRAALSDPSGAVRTAVLATLLKRDHALDVDLIGAALSISDPSERATAADVLLETDHPSSTQVLTLYLEAVAGPDRTFTEDWVHRAGSSVDSSARSDAVRLAAETIRERQGALRAQQIVELDTGTAAAKLVDGLDDDDHRLEIMRLLGSLRHPAAIDALVDHVHAPDPETRRIAVTALGEIRHPAGVDALLRATLDEDYDVRDAAMTAIDRLGTAGAVWGMASMTPGVLKQSSEPEVAIEPPSEVPIEMPVRPALTERTAARATMRTALSRWRQGRS